MNSAEPESPDSLDVGVIGVGSMGQHHARVYSELPDVNLVGVSDVDIEQAKTVATRHGTRQVPRDTLLEAADAVSVVVPTQFHFDTAKAAIEKGTHVLIEKPLVNDVEQGKALIEFAKSKDITLQVGHIERFNPAIQTLQEVVKGFDILAIDINRLGPPPARSIQDSAVIDLMIHDIDIVLSLLGRDPQAVYASGLRENRFASATLEFDPEVVVNLTASRLTQKKVRTIEITTEECLISVDYIEKSVELYRKSVPEYIEKDGDIHYRHEGIIEKPVVERGEPLQKELEAFVEAVKTGSEPVVSGEDGIQALELAQEIEALALGEYSIGAPVVK